MIPQDQHRWVAAELKLGPLSDMQDITLALLRRIVQLEREVAVLRLRTEHVEVKT